MKIKLLSVAEQEFVEAVDYYNDQCQGLGYEFAAEINSTMERIVSFPQAWTQISSRTRRCLTNKFPFDVIYQVRNDTIFDYWYYAYETRPYSLAEKIGSIRRDVRPQDNAHLSSLTPSSPDTVITAAFSK